MHKNSITNSSIKNSGFTLIEAIVTVSIVAILLSIAVPNFTAMIESNRITAGTNELVSTLLLARSEALKRSNNVSVCVSDDQNTCLGVNETDYAKGWIVFLDCDSDGTIDSGANSVACDTDGVVDDSEEIIKVHGEIKGLNITDTRGGGSHGFMGYTFAGRSQAFTFNVRVNGDATIKKSIVINRTGRVSTQ